MPLLPNILGAAVQWGTAELLLHEVKGSGLRKEAKGLVDSPSSFEILGTGKDGVLPRVA